MVKTCWKTLCLCTQCVAMVMQIKLTMPGNIPNWHGAAGMCASKLRLQDTQFANSLLSGAAWSLLVGMWAGLTR